MSYKIKDYHRKNAQDLGVKIEPSKRKNKKIDVTTRAGIVSIGQKGYGDYAIYREKDKDLAERKRKNYRVRHDCVNAKSGTAKHLACEILWGNRKKGILRGK